MIAFVDNYGEFGGGQVALIELIRELATRISPERIALVCPCGPLADAAARVGVVTQLAAPPASSLALLHGREGLDLVVVNGLRWLPAVVSWRFRQRRRPPIVFVQHSRPATRARRLAAALLLRTVDRVVPVARSSTPRGNTVAVPPLGLTERRFAELSAKPAAPLTGEVKAMGRLDPVKGLDLIAPAFAALAARHPNARFRVAVSSSLESTGSEYERSTLAQLRPFLVDGSRDSSWFSPGDIVVIPSRSEMACLTAQEALAAGAIVVASAVGDLPDLLEESVTGFLVPPDNVDRLVPAVGRALSLDASSAVSMAKLGRMRAAERVQAWYVSVADHLSATVRRPIAPAGRAPAPSRSPSW